MSEIEGPTPASERLRRLNTKRSLWIKRMRYAALAVAILGFYLIASRYELLQLPAESCSPIQAFEPGDHLLIDRNPPQLFLGDEVFFRTPEGELALGRIEVPPGTPEGTERVERGYWVVRDATNCSTPDSQSLGPVADDAIIARVLFNLRF